jgi:hypothetical protein
MSDTHERGSKRTAGPPKGSLAEDSGTFVAWARSQTTAD